MIAHLLRLSLCLLLSVAVLASTGVAAHHAMEGHGGVSLAAAPALHDMTGMDHGDHTPPGDHHTDDAQQTCCLSMTGGCGVWADIGPSCGLSDPGMATILAQALARQRLTGVTPEQNPRPPRV